jgi:hypothetical protein
LQVTSEQFRTILRILSKKGVFSILKHLAEKGEMRYYEIQKAALQAKLVWSRSQVDVGLTIANQIWLDRQDES